MTNPQKYSPWRPHPWHGLDVGPNPPELVHAYIEVTSFDAIKYELHKETGILWASRPQLLSSVPPALYGFIPQTYCGGRVLSLCPQAKSGDNDPLDIMVVSDRPVNRSEVFLIARVIGGFQMVDHGEADDKIIAVLQNDTVWSNIRDISELPENMVKRMWHYFLTYKMIPGEAPCTSIDKVYSKEHAFKVIQAAHQDYLENYGESEIS